MILNFITLTKCWLVMLQMWMCCTQSRYLLFIKIRGISFANTNQDPETLLSDWNRNSNQSINGKYLSTKLFWHQFTIYTKHHHPVLNINEPTSKYWIYKMKNSKSTMKRSHKLRLLYRKLFYSYFYLRIHIYVFALGKLYNYLCVL